jgi:hypothetical protein
MIYCESEASIIILFTFSSCETFKSFLPFSRSVDNFAGMLSWRIIYDLDLYISDFDSLDRMWSCSDSPFFFKFYNFIDPSRMWVETFKLGLLRLFKLNPGLFWRLTYCNSTSVNDLFKGLMSFGIVSSQSWSSEILGLGALNSDQSNFISGHTLWARIIDFNKCLSLL